MEYLTNYLPYRKKHYTEKDIKCERSNFIFLKNGTMIYDIIAFDSYLDALIDAVKNRGEELDEMINLVFTSYNKNLKQMLLEEINK